MTRRTLISWSFDKAASRVFAPSLPSVLGPRVSEQINRSLECIETAQICVTLYRPMKGENLLRHYTIKYDLDCFKMFVKFHSCANKWYDKFHGLINLASFLTLIGILNTVIKQ